MSTPKSSRGKANGHHSASAFEVASAPKPILAGVDGVLEKALGYFRRAAFTGQARPLLLTGAKGSGKTAIAKAIGETLEADRSVLAELVYDDVGRLDPDARVNSIKETMTKWIDDARRKSPCVLVLDNLDLILGPENELSASSNPAILAEHFSNLFSASALPAGVLVLATATGSAGLHPLLTSKHIFGDSFKIPPPKQETRREILEAIVASQQKSYQGVANHVDGEEEEALDYVTLAQLTEGYSASDLNDFVTGALQQSMIRGAKEGKVEVRDLGETLLTPVPPSHGRLRRCARSVHSDQPAWHLLAKVGGALGRHWWSARCTPDPPRDT